MMKIVLIVLSGVLFVLLTLIVLPILFFISPEYFLLGFGVVLAAVPIVLAIIIFNENLRKSIFDKQYKIVKPFTKCTCAHGRSEKGL